MLAYGCAETGRVKVTVSCCGWLVVFCGGRWRIASATTW